MINIVDSDLIKWPRTKTAEEFTSCYSKITAETHGDIVANRFQEIVRLNAGNVLGAEDAGPARRWVSLIDQALNSTDEEAPVSAAAYRLAASKQMVGVFLSVWMRAGLVPLVSDVKVSCVRRGVMGCTGNKVEFLAPSSSSIRWQCVC